MAALTSERFAEFFLTIHGHQPYDWQQRLVARAADGDWPDVIDLPTGSGKTACLDAAVFALACQAARPPAERNAPVRIFFCVNRRVIVDEAYLRAVKIATKLYDAEQQRDGDILGEVAAALRLISGGDAGDKAPPLDVLALRGGAYRDNRWARSATQPTIVTTTVDQLGSRLLFRGYGVSNSAAPIQAALIAYDSLVLLDEAHINRPFFQTLSAVRRYLQPDRWAEEPLGVIPMRVVPMTATPPEGCDAVFGLSDADRQDARLSLRLGASKRATLAPPVKSVDKEAVKLAIAAGKERPSAVGVIVNRVATAKAIYDGLRKTLSDSEASCIELVIGSMRPIDRDRQSDRLRGLVGPGRPSEATKTGYVISTQCLEVGADYDFDVLITECASLDALRQRFGRLNRGGRPIEAAATILIDERQAKSNSKLDDDKPEDPIYGNALARTWNWLSERAVDGVIDFGVDAFGEVLAAQEEKTAIPPELLSPSSRLDAPTIMPTYVDFWRQTSPQPVPDPDVALFLHGPQRVSTDMRVCWRADLPENQGKWAETVALIPPSSAECMSVPIGRLKQFLTGNLLKGPKDQRSDLEFVPSSDKEEDSSDDFSVKALLWRGYSGSGPLRKLSDLRPGDTIVLPVSAEGGGVLGHIPSQELDAIDIADEAFESVNQRIILRLHPSLLSDDLLPEANTDRVKKNLLDLLSAANTVQSSDEQLNSACWKDLLDRAAEDLIAVGESADAERLKFLASGKLGPCVDRYPDDRGFILKSRRRVENQPWFLPALDDGADALSQTMRSKPVTLVDHTQHVVDRVQSSVAKLPIGDFAEAFTAAAELHDLGKADERFQALLCQTARTDAWLFLTGPETETLLAKSASAPSSPRQYDQARRLAMLPKGFRHEMLSLQIAERHPTLPSGFTDRDLALHLIASHHGYAAPFAPVVIDDDPANPPPDIEADGVRMSSADRLACPPHRLDSGVADRFWRLVRRYGWWGLAYLESVFRLADQQASAAEESSP